MHLSTISILDAWTGLGVAHLGPGARAGAGKVVGHSETRDARAKTDARATAQRQTRLIVDKTTFLRLPATVRG